MDPITAKLMSAAGAAAEPVYVEDVFSIDLWTGTGSARSITNGIDISGEGGMIWTKSRTSGLDHYLSGPDIGTNSVVRPNSNSAKDTSYTSSFTAFNSNGFSLGTDGIVNGSGTDYVGWTFRKCPGFFDIVTYTGTGSSGKTVSHSLGSSPGSIWVKRLDSADNWSVFHRSIGTSGIVELNNSDGENPNSNIYTGVSSTNFTLGSDSSVNASGESYVAYVFAHDDQSFGDDGNEAIIKCGSTSGSSSDREIDLGFEPQLLILKKSSSSGEDWGIYDTMRGLTTGVDAYLSPNKFSAEANNFTFPEPRSNGFALTGAGANNTYIYIAIRRPHKPPEDAAECFDAFSQTGSNSTQLRPGTAGSSVTDATWIKGRNTATHWVQGTRLTGSTSKRLSDPGDGVTTNIFGSTINVWDQMSGTEIRADSDISSSSYNYMNYHFTRKPGFCDILVYKGTGSSGLSVPHNLGATPEFMIMTSLSSSTDWWALTSSNYGKTNANDAFTSSPFVSFGSTNITINTTGTSSNASGSEYLTYLFATLSGISKVGTYVGTASALTIDCGFTSGARFVVIKNTDEAWNWAVFSTAQGLTSGSDNLLSLNTSGTEDSFDYIDSHNSGFTLAADGGGQTNESGANYFFFAIA